MTRITVQDDCFKFDSLALFWRESRIKLNGVVRYEGKFTKQHPAVFEVAGRQFEIEKVVATWLALGYRIRISSGGRLLYDGLYADTGSLIDEPKYLIELGWCRFCGYALALPLSVVMIRIVDLVDGAFTWRKIVILIAAVAAVVAANAAGYLLCRILFFRRPVAGGPG